MATPKIEDIKLYRCQQEIKGMGACDEIAEVRLTIPGLSVTLCAEHGTPYKIGDRTFVPVYCQNCKKVCKPGYLKDGEYGHIWCNEECREKEHARRLRRAEEVYAGRQEIPF